MQEWFGFEKPRAIYKRQVGQTLPSVDNLSALSSLQSKAALFFGVVLPLLGIMPGGVITIATELNIGEGAGTLEC